MIITVSGLNGSGKTAASKRLAKELGFSWWGMGEVKRALAQREGMTIQEFDERSHREPDAFHHAFDEQTRRIGVEQDDIVVDARAAWYFIPHSWKVFFTARDAVRAERVFRAGRDTEHTYRSPEEALTATDLRAQRFRDALQREYGIDVYDSRQFDVVVDTSDLPVEAVVDAVRASLPQE